ncbi:hypothetical protein VZT92_007804 [Zoarces viviparus]|uniref:Transposase n=1 Tax=Zoarces viviparus TaxID=48416 RepID=A0AAW1FMJ4_ZOAVI
MVEFVEKLMRDTLEIPPQTTDLSIERAQWALAPKPTRGQRRQATVNNNQIPQIQIKEEILRKAWGKKRVLLNERLIYFDQDYPPTVLRNSKKYSEAKRALKQRQIRFQTPYPAKLRVFYEDGTWLYQSAEEATVDMKDRGLPVSVITPRESLTEQLSRSAWGVVRGPTQHGTRKERVFKRLRAFRRQPSPPPEEP